MEPKLPMKLAVCPLPPLTTLVSMLVLIAFPPKIFKFPKHCMSRPFDPDGFDVKALELFLLIFFRKLFLFKSTLLGTFDGSVFPEVCKFWAEF
jgi:hypothetical protein